MEEAHLETCRAVALVDADSLFRAVVVGWERELDEILHVAAVAGPGVCFEIGHGWTMVGWIWVLFDDGGVVIKCNADSPNLYARGGAMTCLVGCKVSDEVTTVKDPRYDSASALGMFSRPMVS